MKAFPTHYIQQLEAFAACSAVPRVRALHLPPDPPPGAERGEFCALELEDGSLGLSYVLLGDTLAALRASSAVQAGADALQLARAFAGPPGPLRTLGLAAANAVTRCLFNRAGYVPPVGADSLAGLNPQPGDQIGMVGLFKPLVGRIVAAGAGLTVVELRPELVGQHDGWRVTTDLAALQQCGQILATGTLLLNDTLDDVLAACRHARTLALVGPSLGCLPDALFERGVTVLGSTWVLDGPAFVGDLLAGQARSLHARKCVLSAADYPGLPVLLSRL